MALYVRESKVVEGTGLLEEELLQRSKELAALNAIAETVSGSLGLDEVLNNALDKVLEITGFEAGGIGLVDEAKEMIVPMVYRGVPGAFLSSHEQPRAGDGLRWQAVKSGESIFFQDIPHDPRIPKERRALVEGFYAAAYIPLKVKDRVVGFMRLGTRQEHRFTPENKEFLMAMSNQIGIAIENARLFEGETRKATQLAVINEVSRRAISILDLHEMLREVARSICSGFGYYNVSLFLVDKDRHEAVIEAVAGGFEHMAPGEYRQSLDQGIIGWVIRTGRSWLANDVSQDPYYVKGFLEKVLTISELCVPIKLGEEVIGALDIQSIHLNAFDETDVTAMETLSSQIAIAIENARLFNGAQQRITELATLNEIGRAISSTMKLHDLLELIYHQTCRVMEVSAFYIALYDQEKEELRSVIDMLHGQHRPQEERSRKSAKGRTEHITRTKKPLLIRGDVQETYRRLGIVSSDKRARAFAGVPITADDEVIGVLAVQNYERDDAYDEHTIELLSTIANQATIAIENARLYGGLRAELAERKRAEEALQESEENYRALMNEAPIGICNTDLKGTITYVNKRFEEVSGYSREEVVGKNGFKLGMFPDETLKFLGERMKARLRGEPARHLEIRFKCKDGRWIWVDILGRVIKRWGVPVGLQLTSRDITERKRAEEALRSAAVETLEAVSSIVEANDPYTAGHSARVTELAIEIARKMGLRDGQIETLRIAGFLHDVGKVGIPGNVLNKPARLTQAEWLMIQAHPVVSAQTAERVAAFEDAVPAIRHHHERWDGTGYPDGLKGEEIPLLARILAVADGYDAMTSERPYRRALTEEEVLAELEEGAGTQWDSQVVDVLVKMYEEGALKELARTQ